MMRTVLLAGLLALAACATPYQGKGLLGGVSATWIADDVAIISGEGNGYTKESRLYEMMLLRAAEEALSHGYAYFAPVQGRSGTTETMWVNRVPGSSSFYTVPIKKPNGDMTFGYYREKPEGLQPGQYYDAQSVYDALAPKYIRK